MFLFASFLSRLLKKHSRSKLLSSKLCFYLLIYCVGMEFGVNNDKLCMTYKAK